jgi:NAD(P)-dependent dehydrogenase (short-subunit alcohol dehydrogenase family)
MAWDGAAGKRILITGATDGIGLVACEALARLGADLSIVARSPQKADRAVERIVAAGGAGTTVDVLMADLASQAAVRGLAEQVLARYPRLDVLVNNAGAIYSARQATLDGIELTWALNHLAPFLLTALLCDRLAASGPARIVTTSSDAHRGASIPFDDLNADHGYRGFRRYGQTKLANILFTSELARRLGDADVTANCFHPGLVATGFNRNNGMPMRLAMAAMRPFSRTPVRGADTLVWLVDSLDVEDLSGLYFADRRPAVPSPAARDLESARRLWDVSLAQTGLGTIF